MSPAVTSSSALITAIVSISFSSSHSLSCLSGSLVLTSSLTVSLLLPLQPSAIQHPPPTHTHTLVPNCRYFKSQQHSLSQLHLEMLCRCLLTVYSDPSFLHALSLCSNLSIHCCLEYHPNTTTTPSPIPLPVSLLHPPVLCCHFCQHMLEVSDSSEVESVPLIWL